MEQSKKRSVMKIACSLSIKKDASGYQEILLSCQRRVDDKVIRMRAKSGVFVDASYFKDGFIVDLSNKRLLTPDVVYHKEQYTNLSKLIENISEKFNEADKSEVQGDWLKLTVDKYLHPDKYLKAEQIEAAKSIYDKAVEYNNLQDVCIGRKRSFLVAVRCMYRYEQFLAYMERQEKKQADITPSFSWGNVEAITDNDIEDFKDFLRNESELAKEYKHLFEDIVKSYPDGLVCRRTAIEERGGNSIALKLKQIKGFYSWLVTKNRASRNPFDGVTIGSGNYGTPYYLTTQERDQLAVAPMPSKALEAVRDIFVFQTYCGARVSDLTTFTKKNLNGNILTYIPKKTAKDSDAAPQIPLLDVPMALIKKYKGVDKKGRLFPFISDQKYNDYIKKCFESAGLTRNVSVLDSLTGKPTTKRLCDVASSHLARRCFVGIMYSKGEDLSTIASMSGHSKRSREITRYYTVGEERRKKAVQSLKGEDGLQAITAQLARLTPEQLKAVLESINK